MSRHARTARNLQRAGGAGFAAWTLAVVHAETTSGSQHLPALLITGLVLAFVLSAATAWLRRTVTRTTLPARAKYTPPRPQVCVPDNEQFTALMRAAGAGDLEHLGGEL